MEDFLFFSRLRRKKERKHEIFLKNVKNLSKNFELDIYFLKDLKKLDIDYFKNIVDNRFEDELNKYSYKHLDLTKI